MICTNYSIDPFKSIAAATNKTIADRVAALIESDKFVQWLGSSKAPVVRDMKITNATNDVWDLKKTLDVWRKDEEVKQKFRDSNGDPVKWDAAEDGVFSKLTTRVRDYNREINPFKARIVRKTENGKEVYTIQVDYNKQHVKLAQPLADKPVVDRNDPESFFYMRHYDPAVFADGRKTVSVRPEMFQSGVYQIGNDFFRVALRGGKRMFVKDAKEGKTALRKAFVQDDAIEFSHIQDFFDGKLPMFVYDIQKLDVTPEQGKAMPDFLGAMVTGSRKGKKSKDLTGYADIDKYINALNEAKSDLYRKRTVFRNDQFKLRQIDNAIEALNMDIETLKADAELPTLMVVGRQVLFGLKEKLKGPLSFVDLDTGLRLSKAWAEIGEVIDFLQETDDADVKQLLEEAEKLRSVGQTLFTEYRKRLGNTILETTDAVVNKKIDKATGKELLPSQTLRNADGEIVIDDINYLFGAATVGGSFSENALENLQDHLIDKANYEATERSHQFETELNTALADYLGELPNHIKGSNFDFLFRTDAAGNKILLNKIDTGFLKALYIRRYQAFEKGKRKKQHSENYNAALALGATEEELKGNLGVKEYYKWEKDHFTYTLSKEGQEAFDEFMLNIRDKYRTGELADLTPVYDEEAIEKVRKEYDPQGFQDYIDGKSRKYNKGNRWYTKELTAPPISKEYAALNDKQKKFYDFYVNAFIQGQQNLAMDHRFGQVELEQQLLEFAVTLPGSLGDKMAHLGKGLQDFAKSIIMTRSLEDDVVKESTSPLTGKKRESAEFKHIGEFIPGPNEFGKTNPIEILDMFRKAGHLFQHKRALEDVLYAISDVANTAKKSERSAHGKLKITPTGSLFTTTDQTNRAKRIDYKTKVFLTDIRKDPIKTNAKKGEWKASGAQFVDQVNNYTRLKNMALSPMSGLTNWIGGSVNNYIYAASGEFFNDKELSHAYWLLKENMLKALSFNKLETPTAHKVVSLIERYSLLGDVTEELYHENDLLSKFYVLQKNGEFMNQGSTAVAMLLREKVKLKEVGADGKPLEKSLWDLYEVNEKTKKVELRKDLIAEDDKFQKDEELFKFFQKVKKVNRKIHGDYSEALMIKKDVLGRVAMMFRTWLPMAIKERFGAEYQDDTLGAQKGRYISAWDVMAKGLKSGDGRKDVAVAVAKLLLPIIGRKIKFSENMSDVDQRNMMMFVREMHFIMMLTLACLATKAQVDDDEDPNTKSLLRYLYNQGERSQSELMFFFIPKDFIQITKDAAPITQTFMEMYKVVERSVNYMYDPEGDVYEKGFRKGHSKAGTAWRDLFPVIRQANKVWSAKSQIFSDARYQ